MYVSIYIVALTTLNVDVAQQAVALLSASRLWCAGNVDALTYALSCIQVQRFS
jgi:hypothetical protein